MKGPIVFRTTYASERLMESLAEHAKTLPEYSKARAAIKVLIRRWINDGEIVHFTETGIEPRLTRDGALNVLADSSLGMDAGWDLQDFFAISAEEIDARITETRELMEEAA